MLATQPIRLFRPTAMLASQPARAPKRIQLMIPMAILPFSHSAAFWVEGDAIGHKSVALAAIAITASCKAEGSSVMLPVRSM
jgi:hypothetical protein